MSQRSRRFLFTHSCPESTYDFSSYLIENDLLKYAQWQLEHSTFLFIHGYLETKEYTTTSRMNNMIPGGYFVYAGDREACFKMLSQRDRLGPWFTGEMLWEPAVLDENIVLQIVGNTNAVYNEYVLFINYLQK